MHNNVCGANLLVYHPLHPTISSFIAYTRCMYIQRRAILRILLLYTMCVKSREAACSLFLSFFLSFLFLFSLLSLFREQLSKVLIGISRYEFFFARNSCMRVNFNVLTWCRFLMFCSSVFYNSDLFWQSLMITSSYCSILQEDWSLA